MNFVFPNVIFFGLDDVLHCLHLPRYTAVNENSRGWPGRSSPSSSSFQNAAFSIVFQQPWSIHSSNDALRAPLQPHCWTIWASLFLQKIEPWSSDLPSTWRRRKLKCFLRPHRVSCLHFTLLNYRRLPPVRSFATTSLPHFPAPQRRGVEMHISADELLQMLTMSPLTQINHLWLV